jgi:5-methylcytosine-specific restriction endonuclease McrA
MPDEKSTGKDEIITKKAPESSLIERSKVTPNLPYSEYKETLREDFIYACAYCTITEFEAQGIRMTIDHYEPQTARPELTNEYDNLMYCCDDCNALKGNRCPPQP